MRSASIFRRVKSMAAASSDLLLLMMIDTGPDAFVHRDFFVFYFSIFCIQIIIRFSFDSEYSRKINKNQWIMFRFVIGREYWGSGCNGWNREFVAWGETNLKVQPFLKISLVHLEHLRGCNILDWPHKHFLCHSHMCPAEAAKSTQIRNKTAS